MLLSKSNEKISTELYIQKESRKNGKFKKIINWHPESTLKNT